MTNTPSPTEPTAAPPAIGQFEPVPRLLIQENGWTPARQRAFIEKLAETPASGRLQRR